MYTEKSVVKCESGLHNRQATFFIQKANEFRSSIWIEVDDRKINAKSLLGVLSMAITTGTEWKQIHCRKGKKLLYMFTFPIFMLTYIPISLVALFNRKVQWKPIEHHRADQRVLETAAAGRNK